MSKPTPGPSGEGSRNAMPSRNAQLFRNAMLAGAKKLLARLRALRVSVVNSR